MWSKKKIYSERILIKSCLPFDINQRFGIVYYLLIK
jgi:hypothetical protein